jgi:hypothetical protein
VPSQAVLAQALQKGCRTLGRRVTSCTPNDSNDSNDPNDSNDSNDSNDPNDPNDPNDSNDPNDPNDPDDPNDPNDQFNVNDTVTDMMTWTGTPFSSVGVNRHCRTASVAAASSSGTDFSTFTSRTDPSSAISASTITMPLIFAACAIGG